MVAYTIRPRVDGDLPACVEALATVHAADRYPVRWPRDAAGWLTPGGTLGAWVAVEGRSVGGHSVGGHSVGGHVVLTRLDAQADVDLTEAVGRRAEELAAVARLFVGVPTRGRGQARALLAHAARAAHTMKLQPILEVESGAASAIALYERSGWRFVGSRTETWIAPNGRPAELRVYLGPA